MKLYLYYDEELIVSILSQLDLPEFEIDFFSVSIEERKDSDYKVSMDPIKEKCSFHLSSGYFEGKRVEHIYANIEYIKNVRKNKFIYKAIDKIVENIKEYNNIFYSESKIDEKMKVLCDMNKFTMSKTQFECCNCDRIVTLAYKISENCIKPICIYLKC